MTYTTLLLTHLDQAELIHMPSRFTSTEANFFKQLFQQFSCSSEPVADKQPNLTIKKVIVDFGKTTFIDNGGLVGLCQILRLARESQTELNFLSFSPQVKMVLSLAGLEQVFTIENSSNDILNTDRN